MKLNRANLQRWKWGMLPPLVIPLLILVLQIVANPNKEYNWSKFSFDFAFAAISFDIWAIQTLFSQRRVVYGGLFDLPTIREGRNSCLAREGFFVISLLLAHIIFIMILTKSNGSHHFLVHGIAIAASLFGPIGLILGWFISEECHRVSQ